MAKSETVGAGKDPHRGYERRMVAWLALTYAALGLLTAALVAYCAWRMTYRRH